MAGQLKPVSHREHANNAVDDMAGDVAVTLKTLRENLELSGEMQAQGEFLGMNEFEAGGDGGDDLFGDAREDEAEGPVEEIAEDEAEDVAPKGISPDQECPPKRRSMSTRSTTCRSDNGVRNA